MCLSVETVSGVRKKDRMRYQRPTSRFHTSENQYQQSNSRPSASAHRGGRSFGSAGRGQNRSGGNRGRTMPTFNPSDLVRRAEPPQPQAPYTPSNSIESLEISQQLKTNLQTKGYTDLTPIQDQIIPAILAGRDVVGIANTGSGKTAAFLVPLITKIAKGNARGLIIAPTRELAVQIQSELKSLSTGLNLFSALCIGGSSMNRQIDQLRRRPQFVIGTPGRLKDLHQRKQLNFADFNTIVLDEVDRMLDMGFVHDIRHIIAHLPAQKQSLFFSATLSESIKNIMQGFLRDPFTVTIKSNQVTTNINQDIIRTNGRPKVEILHELLITEGFHKVIVFGRTKRSMENLSRNLSVRGLKVASIHSNKSQNQRQLAIHQFRSSLIQVLVATDVVARGLDIDDVTHVINYDLPTSYEDYIHRIGRTGRANKTGTALTFVD